MSAERKKRSKSMSSQLKESANTSPQKEDAKFKPYEGNTELVVSTGSTLADLAISGNVVRGGGLPAGIVVEIRGLYSVGKTAWMTEIAGNVGRAGGGRVVMDPERRLRKEFAKIFGLDLKTEELRRPRTVWDVFDEIKAFKPERTDVINGFFVDSRAALISTLELEDKKDEYGRIAREFSMGLRRYSPTIQENNYIMVCTNQLRENISAGGGSKYYSPGGQAFRFYASLQLTLTKSPAKPKIKRTRTFKGSSEEEVIGINSVLTVDKSSVDRPYRTAPISIIFDYGVDDIRDMLNFVKRYNGVDDFTVRDEAIGKKIDTAIRNVEKNNYEAELRKQVIELWEEREELFKSDRKPKER